MLFLALLCELYKRKAWLALGVTLLAGMSFGGTAVYFWTRENELVNTAIEQEQRSSPLIDHVPGNKRAVLDAEKLINFPHLPAATTATRTSTITKTITKDDSNPVPNNSPATNVNRQDTHQEVATMADAGFWASRILAWMEWNELFLAQTKYLFLLNKLQTQITDYSVSFQRDAHHYSSSSKSSNNKSFTGVRRRQLKKKVPEEEQDEEAESSSPRRTNKIANKPANDKLGVTKSVSQTLAPSRRTRKALSSDTAFRAPPRAARVTAKATAESHPPRVPAARLDAKSSLSSVVKNSSIPNHKIRSEAGTRGTEAAGSSSQETKTNDRRLSEPARRTRSSNDVLARPKSGADSQILNNDDSKLEATEISKRQAAHHSKTNEATATKEEDTDPANPNSSISRSKEENLIQARANASSSVSLKRNRSKSKRDDGGPEYAPFATFDSERRRLVRQKTNSSEEDSEEGGQETNKANDSDRDHDAMATKMKSQRLPAARAEKALSAGVFSPVIKTKQSSSTKANSDHEDPYDSHYQDVVTLLTEGAEKEEPENDNHRDTSPNALWFLSDDARDAYYSKVENYARGGYEALSSGDYYHNKYNLAHVIQTEFLQYQLDKVHLANARFSLFETFTLPSIRQQSNQEFLWLIWVDPNLGYNAKQRLQNLLKDVPNAIVLGHHYKRKTANWDFRDWNGLDDEDAAAQALMLGSFKLFRAYHEASQHRLLLETRLDADDALHKNFTESVQRQVAETARDTSTDALISTTDFRILCPEHHTEWRYYHDKSDNKEADLAAKRGHLVHHHNPAFCINSGMTIAYQIRAKSRDMKTLKQSSMHITYPPCPRAEEQNIDNADNDHDISTSTSSGRRCIARIVMIGKSIDQAVLQARTPTAAGMKRVFGSEKTYKATFESIEAQKDAWNRLADSFGVEKKNVWNLRRQIENNIRNILQDALEGQCSPGHSCRAASKRKLVALIARVDNNDEDEELT